MEAGEVPRCSEDCAELEDSLLVVRKGPDILRTCGVLRIVWTCLGIVKTGIAY